MVYHPLVNRMTPEALARIHIDQLLQAAGWQVHDLKLDNVGAD